MTNERVHVAFLFRVMGVTPRAEAERATYIAALLTFITSVIGVGHFFLDRGTYGCLRIRERLLHDSRLSSLLAPSVKLIL